MREINIDLIDELCHITSDLETITCLQELARLDATVQPICETDLQFDRESALIYLHDRQIEAVTRLKKLSELIGDCDTHQNTSCTSSI